MLSIHTNLFLSYKEPDIRFEFFGSHIIHPHYIALVFVGVTQILCFETFRGNGRGTIYMVIQIILVMVMRTVLQTIRERVERIIEYSVYRWPPRGSGLSHALQNQRGVSNF